MGSSQKFLGKRKRLVKKVEQITDEALIHAIQNMIEYAKIRDEEILGESVEEYNQKIDKAVVEIESGKFLEHKEVVKRIGEWRKKRR